MNNLDDLEGEDFADNEEVDGTPEAYHAEVSTNPVNVTTLGEEYDYDVETNLNSFFWDELLPTLIVYSLTFILGLVGNILIIFTTFRYRKMKSTTNVFLASLASADLLLIVFCIPVKESTVIPSDKDNPPAMADCPEIPRELSKQVALHKLREILDELVSDEEKVEEVTGNLDMQKGDSSKRTAFVNMFGKEESLELEELMVKLKTMLKNSSQVLKPVEMNFYEGTTVSELLTPNSALLGGITPQSVPPVIAYPVSVARCLRIGSSYRRDEEHESYTVPTYQSGHGGRTRDKYKRDGTAQTWMQTDSGGAEHLIMTSVPYDGTKDSELHNLYSSTRVPVDSARNSDEVMKSEKTRSFNSKRYEKSYRPENSHVSAGPTSSGRRGQTCPGRKRSKCVERKILKLECRLKDMLQKIGVCPPQDQIALRKCLERLRETSEAVLKRIRTYRLDSCDGYCGDRGDMLDINHKGYQSEPESAVRVNAEKKPIIVKTSGSEIQLNVGMEITMENFDPETGRKILPEENKEFEQQGNIQCKLVKSGEKPVTFIDTDFLYNPKTGMLFHRGHKTDRKYRSKDIKEPLKPMKTYLLSKTMKRDFPAETDSDSTSRKAGPHGGDLTLQHLKSIKCTDRSSSPETSKSVLADAFRLAIEREEANNARRLLEGRDTSRSFPREKPRCSGKHCNRRRVSLKPIIPLSEKHGSPEVTAQGVLKIMGDNRTQQTYHLHKGPQGNYPDVHQEEIMMRTVMVSDKGMQTNLGPRWRTSSESIPKRSTGIQAGVEPKPKVLVNRSADTNFLGTPLWALRRGVNVCAQTISTEILPGMRKSSDVTSQTDFLIEEAQKYQKDLETQKRLAKLFSYTWTFGFFICKLVYYMQSVSAICSVLTLTAMSVERYYAIVHPMRAQYVCTISQARRIITFTWISSFFLAIPVLFAQIHMPVGVRVKGFWCVRDYDNPTIWRAHETYMLLLILIIPTGVMGVAYTTICLEIWQVMQRRQDLTSAKILNIRYNKASMNTDSFGMFGKEKKQQRNTYGESPDDEAHVKQVIKMLVAVVVIYVVCWGPLLIDNILQAYGVLPFMKFGKQKYMATAFHLMAYFNSCINPIVYGFMSKNFRESFHKTLCCTTRKGHTSMRNTSMSHDRNTSIRYAESSFGRTVSIAMPD